MSQKFHINKHGVPAPCKATKGNCPLGGEHFDTMEAAQNHVDKVNEKEHMFLPSVEGTKELQAKQLPSLDSPELLENTKSLSSLESKSKQREDSLYDKVKEDGSDFIDPINKEYSELANEYERLKSEGPPRERFLLFFSRKSRLSNQDYAIRELNRLVEDEGNSSEKKARLRSMAQSIIHSKRIERNGGRYGEGYEVQGVSEAINVLKHNGVNVEMERDSNGEKLFTYNGKSSSTGTLNEKDIISSAESIVRDLKKDSSPGSKAMLSMYQNQALNDKRSAYKGHHYRVEDVRKRPNYKNPIKLSEEFLNDDFSIVNSSTKNLNENFEKLNGHENPGYYINKAEDISYESSQSYGERDQDTSDARSIATKMWKDSIYEPTKPGHVKEEIGDRLLISNIDQARLVLKNKGLTLNPQYGEGGAVNWSISDDFRGKSNIPNDLELNDESIMGLANDIIDNARERNDESNLMFYQKVIDDKFR